MVPEDAEASSAASKTTTSTDVLPVDDVEDSSGTSIQQHAEQDTLSKSRASRTSRKRLAALVTLAAVVVAAIIATVVVARRPHDIPTEAEAQAVDYPEGQGSEEIPYGLNASDLVLVDGPGFTSRGSCSNRVFTFENQKASRTLSGGTSFDQASWCRSGANAHCRWVATRDSVENAVEDWLEDNNRGYNVQWCKGLSTSYSYLQFGAPTLIRGSCWPSRNCRTRCDLRCTLRFQCRVC